MGLLESRENYSYYLNDNDSFVLHFIVDQFALPKFSVPAMESWGLISYQESTLLVNVMKGGDIAKRTSAFTIAHELAHTVSHQRENYNYQHKMCSADAHAL